MNSNYKNKYLKYKLKYKQLLSRLSNKQTGGFISYDFILSRDIINNLIKIKELHMIRAFGNILANTLLTQNISYDNFLTEQNEVFNNLNPGLIDVIELKPEQKNKITDRPERLEDSGDYTWILDLTLNHRYWFNGNQVFDSIYWMDSITESEETRSLEINKAINFIRDRIILPNPDYNLYVAIGAGLSMDYNLPEFIIRDIRERGQRYIILIFESFNYTLFVDSTNFYKPLGYAKTQHPELFSNIKCYFYSWKAPIIDVKLPEASGDDFIIFFESIKTTNKNYLYYGLNSCGIILTRSNPMSVSPIKFLSENLNDYTIIGCDGYIKPTKEIIPFEGGVIKDSIILTELPENLDISRGSGVNLQTNYDSFTDDIKYKYYYKTDLIE